MGRDRETDIDTLMLDDKSHGSFTMSAVFFCCLLPLRRFQGKRGFCLKLISARDHHLGRAANVGLR